MDNNGFELALGIVFLFLGTICAVRKRFSFGLGRDNRASAKLTITLTESRAIIFGSVCIAEGVIIVALWLFTSIGTQTEHNGWLGVVTGVGLVIALSVFVGSSFFEFSESSVARDRKGKRNSE
ncbi:MAG: hypothetical protein IT324_13465 [Anaerolineae bacterium]|nr:hypothetical protein [Anaerolineae bacterium]